jgi:hypothetical protein
LFGVYNACQWCTKVNQETLALDLWPLVLVVLVECFAVQAGSLAEQVEELEESVMEVHLEAVDPADLRVQL